MNLPRNITYLVIAIIFILISIATLYFASLHDRTYAPENSNIHNHYESRENLINKIDTQKKIIDKLNLKMHSLEARNSALNQKNVRATDALYTKDSEIKNYQKKLESQRRLDTFECKKSDTNRNNLKNVFNCMGSLKIALVENYQTTGKFPTYLSDLSLQLLPSENELIQEISFGLDGSMNLYVHSRFGIDKKISLTPEVTQAGSIQFSCKTNLKLFLPEKSFCAAY